MKELLEEVEQLKKSINETKEVKEVQKLKEEIMKDKELLKKIEEYKLTQKEELKEEISKNELFQNYKKKETDLNILILKINQKLKELKSEGKNCE